MKYVGLFNERNNSKKIINKQQFVYREYVLKRNIIFKTFAIKKQAQKWLSSLIFIRYYNMKRNDIIFCDSSYRRNNMFIELKIANFDSSASIKYKLFSKIFTNNQGELIVLMFSLLYCIFINKNIKILYSDSKLVVYFWSLNIVNSHDPFVKKLSQHVCELRTIFHDMGGKISHISGDLNPADLGFHKGNN